MTDQTAADRAALRDRIAEALIAWTYRGKDPEHGGILETVRANAYSRADAVLAVLPAPTDRAAVLREAADTAEGLRQFERCTGPRRAAQTSENVGILRVAEKLRRMAAEAQPECSASRTGHCLREAVSETACATEAGECVHGGRAAEMQPAQPWLSDSARIGRTLTWTWTDCGKGERGEGYRAAQVETRALLTGQRGDTEAQQDGPQ